MPKTPRQEQPVPDKAEEPFALGACAVGSEEPENPFTTARRQLDDAARIIELDPDVLELLRWPMRELHVAMPVRMDDGSTRTFHGFWVQYNVARGP